MTARSAQYTIEIVEALKPMNAEKIVLFGSVGRSRPDASLDSDLELLLVLDEERIPATYEKGVA